MSQRFVKDVAVGDKLESTTGVFVVTCKVFGLNGQVSLKGATAKGSGATWGHYNELDVVNVVTLH